MSNVLIPFELVDEEEMQAIEIALQQAALHRRNIWTAAGRFISHSSVSLRTAANAGPPPDIEDTAPTPVAHYFPPKKSLCVTDLTALEWCEKQVEFSLARGKPKKTPAMKAGSARHMELETEVVTRVDIDIQTREDSWAVRLINFLVGTRQLLCEGLTRELPVVSFVEGNWWTGIIDEMQLSESGGPRLIDTKTRLRQSLPSDAQKRNGRLQLMCYKLLWDTLCEQAIPSDEFFLNFQLDPQQQLSEAVRHHVADINIMNSKVECLEELLSIFRTTCAALPLADRLLKLRYEWQADRSLIGEEEFEYDSAWLKQRVQWHLQFWNGIREAELVAQDERWKCNYSVTDRPAEAYTSNSAGSYDATILPRSRRQKPRSPSALSRMADNIFAVNFFPTFDKTTGGTQTYGRVPV